MRKECLIIAKDSIKEVSEEYIIDHHLQQLINTKFLAKALLDASLAAVDEIIIEDSIDNLIDQLLLEFIPPISVHILDEMHMEAEKDELDRGLDNYVFRNVLTILLEQTLFMENQKKQKNAQEINFDNLNN